MPRRASSWFLADWRPASSFYLIFYFNGPVGLGVLFGKNRTREGDLFRSALRADSACSNVFCTFVLCKITDFALAGARKSRLHALFCVFAKLRKFCDFFAAHFWPFLAKMAAATIFGQFWAKPRRELSPAKMTPKKNKVTFLNSYYPIIEYNRVAEPPDSRGARIRRLLFWSKMTKKRAKKSLRREGDSRKK